MDSQMSPKLYERYRMYIEEGIPLEDIKLDRVQVERIRVAEQVFERFMQDPMLDVMMCLRRTFGRSLTQAKRDYEVFNMFLEFSEQRPQRILSMTRARKVAENLIRIGEQTGEWKPIMAGLDRLIRIDGLDKPEEKAENIGERTFALPPVFVRVEAVDPKYQTITEEKRAAIIRKYGGVEDENMEMVRKKAICLATEEKTKEQAKEQGYEEYTNLEDKQWEE